MFYMKMLKHLIYCYTILLVKTIFRKDNPHKGDEWSEFSKWEM